MSRCSTSVAMVGLFSTRPCRSTVRVVSERAERASGIGWRGGEPRSRAGERVRRGSVRAGRCSGAKLPDSRLGEASSSCRNCGGFAQGCVNPV